MAPEIAMRGTGKQGRKPSGSERTKARRPTTGQTSRKSTDVTPGGTKRKRPTGENNQRKAKRVCPLTVADKKKSVGLKRSSFKAVEKEANAAKKQKSLGAVVKQEKRATVKGKKKALPRLVTAEVGKKKPKVRTADAPSKQQSKRLPTKSADKMTAAKKGPGRPKKSNQATPAKNARNTAVKQGRGRPKKLPSPEPETDEKETKRATKGGQKGATKKLPPAKAKYLEMLEFDGTLFEVGDYVYIKKTDCEGAESDEELEECRICGRCPLEGQDMLECDTCLGGFHLGCLDPPLESIPDGDWNCPACSGGECGEWASRERQRARTARERFLAGELYMARINMMWKDSSGEANFRGNWLDIPEETHMGRREHNHRREVFLSTLEDDISMDSIIRHAWVLPRDRFERATNEGDDVYLLEYDYCPRNQWYKRIDEIADDGREWNAEMSQDDAEFQPSDEDAGASGDEDFSADEELEPREKRRGPGRLRGTGTKRKRDGTAEPRSRTQNARRQRLEALSQLGAREIPAAARKRKLSKLEAAQAALTLAALPKKLSCRDKERQQVTSFVEEAVSAGSECLGSCLYISGVPGTGKTATVLEVMRGLHEKVDSKELPPFQFVEINALRVPSPAHVYSALHEALTGEYLGPKNALERLQQRFSSEPRGKSGLARRPLVVLVDELDLLVTRNQSVLYNIFDWPTLPHSRLIVIGIANTIDLPERMLPRIASRMGLRRVAFNPYTREQLQEIVADRLTGIPAFRPEAIELASRKVASASGDVRRALELCRRAAELASARQKEVMLTSAGDVSVSAGGGTNQAGPSSSGGPTSAENLGGEEGDVLVELGDVDGAVKEMFDSPHIKSIERYSRHEQILLLVLVMLMRRTGIAETNFAAVASAHIDMCRAQGELPPSHANLAEIVSRLGSSHVVICEPGSKHRLRKIELNVPSDDVTFALKRSAQVTWLQKLAEQRS